MTTPALDETISLDEMSDDEYAAAVSEAIAALNTRPYPYDFDEALTWAGVFVARFGSLGDNYQEPHLAQVQAAARPEKALDLLVHWSVARNDPAAQPPADFEGHLRTCQICGYLEGVYSLHTQFKYEMCPECGLDLDQHDIGVMTVVGMQVFAMCREPWVRCEPEVSPGGDCAGDYQVSDAYNARWTAPLPNGLNALVTRMFYLTRWDGRTRLEQQIEFLVCRDLSDPGMTEEASNGIYFEVETDDPQAVDLEEMARQAAAPERGLWAKHMPDYADFVLGGEG